MDAKRTNPKGVDVDISKLMAPLKEIQETWPGIWNRLYALRSFHGVNSKPPWPPWSFLPLDLVGSVVEEALGYGSNRLCHLLATLAPWRVTKGIYRFDSDVFEALVDTDLEKMPVEALRRLPEWTIFIPTPSLDTLGFWCGVQDDGGGSPVLLVVELSEDGDVQTCGVRLIDGKDLRGSLEYTMQRDAEVVRATLNSRDRLDPEEAEAYPDWLAQFDDPVQRNTLVEELHERLRPRIALMAYLCSLQAEVSGPDGSGPRRPTPTKTRRGLRYFPASQVKTWDVGLRMGAALRQARRRHEDRTLGTGTGSRMRPHVRVAHFQSFWVGKRVPPDGTRRKGEDVVVKWIPPTLVNASMGEMPLTVRPVQEVA